MRAEETIIPKDSTCGEVEKERGEEEENMEGREDMEEEEERLLTW